MENVAKHEQALLKIYEEHIDRDCGDFAQRLCKGIAEEDDDESNPFSFSRAKECDRIGNMEHHRERFRYLASLILKKIDKPSSTFATSGFLTLKEIIEANFWWDPITVQRDHYDLTSIYDVWDKFFYEPSFWLGGYIGEVSKLIYRGLPIYKRTNEDHRLVSELEEEYIYLKHLGRFYDSNHYFQGFDFSLPTWAEKYSIQAEHLALHEIIFDSNNGYFSEDELNTRRQALQRSIGNKSSTQPNIQSELSPRRCHSRLLSTVEAVINRYYGGQFNPDDADTWTRQTDVIEWLTREHKLTNREAEVVDIVTRPDKARRK
jgi:hypothetical protein